MIPLVDLRAQYAAHKAELDAAVHAVLESGWFIKGPHVEAFERIFAAYLGAEHVVGVGSCTDALWITLGLLHVKDCEVIVPAMTFLATAEAVSLAGGTPVFVDIDPETGLIDLDRCAAAVTPKTRAIVPVHLAGRAVDMIRLMELAKRYGLAVVEDCAQAAGAKWKGQAVGTFGAAGCFSFYPSKNLGAYGDGGAIVTNDAWLADRARIVADHGQSTKGDHAVEGICSRLDALHASVLTAKLAWLGSWNRARYTAACAYALQLHDADGVSLPDIPDDPAEHIFHCFVVRVQNRDRARAIMAEKGIETGFHYKTPVPLARAYARFGYTPESFPEAYAYSRECLSLPLYPEMTMEDVKVVSSALKEAVRG